MIAPILLLGWSFVVLLAVLLESAVAGKRRYPVMGLLAFLSFVAAIAGIAGKLP